MTTRSGLAFTGSVPVPSSTRVKCPRSGRVCPPTVRRLRVQASSRPADTARGEAVARGQASVLPDHARALVLAQLERPIYDDSNPALPGAARAAQRETPPRFLTDEECAELPGGKAAGLLRDRCHDIVRAARKRVVAESPGIEDKGGALWPQFRADACWRDLENFVRVISYGCCAGDDGVGNRLAFLNAEGCSIMDRIYTALEVPRKEMVLGIVGAKEYALSNVMQDLGEEECDRCRSAFDEMIQMLEKMPGKK